MGAPVTPGDVLAGKYRVERVLGEGGMGVVVAARHLQLGQVVALKFLLPEMLRNEEAVGRFLREARNAVQLRSEHVARIIDVGTLETGAPYIVMEFLEGSDLAGVLAQHGALPAPVAIDYVLQACDAIAEAHSLGIVHRDLKPQNLFLTRRHDGTNLVKVLDFGISKSMAGGDFAATRTQAVMGSPAYMSPEQMRSAKLVDARTDVWALGVILYQLVTGHVPWQAETFTELCLKVAMDPLPPIPNPALHNTGFEAVVRRCLEKDPAQRLPDVQALAVALAPFAPPHAHALVERISRVLGSPLSPPSLMSLPMASAPGTGTFGDAAGQRITRTAASSGRRTAGIVAALVAVVVGVVVTAVVAGGADRTPAPAGQPRPSAGPPASAGSAAAVTPAAPPAAPPAPVAPAPTTPDAMAGSAAPSSGSAPVSPEPPVSPSTPAADAPRDRTPPPAAPEPARDRRRPRQPPVPAKAPVADPLSSPD